LFFTFFNPHTPRMRDFVLARAARRALRSHQVASRRTIARSIARSAAICALMLAALALAGCAKKHRTTAAPAPPRINNGEVGLASWYGHPYHGRPAANGEIYDMEKFTAAHRTLPFGTWVRVIDLSHAAAVAIALIGPGVARVRLDILSVPTTGSADNWYAVQAGAFLDRDRAERLRTSLERDFGPAHLVQRADSPSFWRVVVGRLPSEQAASALAERVRQESGTAFVVRLDPSPPAPDATGVTH
jgi:rare lipoprotein A